MVLGLSCGLSATFVFTCRRTPSVLVYELARLGIPFQRGMAYFATASRSPQSSAGRIPAPRGRAPPSTPFLMFGGPALCSALASRLGHCAVAIPQVADLVVIAQYALVLTLHHGADVLGQRILV